MPTDRAHGHLVRKPSVAIGLCGLLLALVLLAGGGMVQTLGANSRQVAPGTGADTEDPRKVLRAAAAALRALRTVSYECRYRGTGAFATRAPTVAARVTIAKLTPGDPMAAKMAVEGTICESGSADAISFRMGFDGHVVRNRSAKTKVVVERNVDTEPEAHSLAGVTVVFGGGAYHSLLFDYVRDNPLSQQVEAATADYEGRTVIGGVLCHVVYVEMAQANGGARRERWFIGVADNLPREVETLVVDDSGRHGAYVLTLSNVHPNRPVDGSAFVVPTPAGYAVKPYKGPNHPELLAVGQPAPDWSLLDQEGRPHRLVDYRGKLVVLDFWATWCGPCVQGMPALERLHAKYRGRGVEIVGINAWEESNAAAYMREKGYTYQLLLKGERVAEAYHATLLPTVYVVGADGSIVYRGIGTDSQTLASVIEAYLRPPEDR